MTASNKTQQRNSLIVLSLLIILKIILQILAINPVYELHRDEFLHIDLGNHLAWGYDTVPPVTGIISWLILALGNSVFWVKFFPALFGVLVIVVVWKTVEELGGSWYAGLLAGMGILFSAFLRINTLYQPNSLDFLCWTLLYYTFLRYTKSGRSKWLYISAAVFVVGFLNKYTMAFLIIGLLPAVLITRQRKVFLNKHLYFAAILALIAILPNLIWQYQHDFPVIRHMNALVTQHLVNVDRLGFLTDQLLFFTGSVFILIIGFIAFFRYRPFFPYRFFFYAFMFTMAAFLYLRAKSYYAIGIYPVFIAFGAVYMEHLLTAAKFRFVRIIILVIPVLIFLPMFQLVLPVLSPDQILQKKDLFDEVGLTRWEDGRIHELPQDYADMLGWSELGTLVDSAYALISDGHPVLIHCDNYGEAGAVNYYGNVPVEALSLHGDYINWYPLDEVEYSHLILVSEPNDDDPDRTRERPMFNEVIYIGEIQHPYARERGARVHLLLGAKISINDILREEISDRLSR